MNRSLCIAGAFLVWTVLAPSAGFGRAQPADSPADRAANYARTVQERAAKIVANLGIADSNQAARVRDIIAEQYVALSGVHEVRDAAIQAAKARSAKDNAAVQAEIQTARGGARPKLDKLHRAFLAKLSAQLSPAQVDQVKDGMTYGVVPLTYGVYLRMYPNLTDAQKQQIMAWLVEAREIAMDEGSSKEKHAVFGKYKGRINNYLSQAGYDAKRAEQNLRDASRPAQENATK